MAWHSLTAMPQVRNRPLSPPKGSKLLFFFVLFFNFKTYF